MNFQEVLGELKRARHEGKRKIEITLNREKRGGAEFLFSCFKQGGISIKSRKKVSKLKMVAEAKQLAGEAELVIVFTIKDELNLPEFAVGLSETVKTFKIL